MGRVQKIIRAIRFGLTKAYRSYVEGDPKIPPIFAVLYSLGGVLNAVFTDVQAYANVWVYMALLYLYLAYKNRKYHQKKNSEQIIQRLKGAQVYE